MTDRALKSIAVTCIDFRLNQAELAEIKPVAVLSLAGGASSLINSATQAVALDQLGRMIKWHEVEVVDLREHWDCGAHGGSRKFGHDHAAEQVAYESELAKAERMVRRHFPNLRVRTAIQSLDPKLQTHHTCRTIVVSDADYQLDDTWARQEYGPHDRVRLAGGARALLEPATQAVLLNQIDISERLHASNTVVLLLPEGGADLTRLAAVVHRRFPRYTVVTATQTLTGPVDVIQVLEPGVVGSVS